MSIPCYNEPTRVRQQGRLPAVSLPCKCMSELVLRRFMGQSSHGSAERERGSEVACQLPCDRAQSQPLGPRRHPMLSGERCNTMPDSPGIMTFEISLGG